MPMPSHLLPLIAALLVGLAGPARASDVLTVLDEATADLAVPAPWEARGVLEPAQEAVLSAPMDGLIVALPVADGDRIAAADPLLRFDCRLRQARLAAAEAQRQAAGHTLENNRRLAAMNSVGALELAVAEAEYRRAAAEVRQAEIMVGYCAVSAPFAGRVVEVMVNAHETVAAGDDLLSVLDDADLEISLIVPSDWLVWLEPGTRFTFRVDETGAAVPAVVTALGARVDPASQSVRIAAQPAGVVGGLLAGMSGTAVFAPPGDRAPGDRGPGG